MQSSIVKINNLSKRFDKSDNFALENINLKISYGKITGLVGADGAGKTTLIRLIAGILRPTQGSITVKDFDSIKNAQQIQSIISYMPQKFGLYEDLTVLENLRLYAELKNITGEERNSRFEKLLEFTDLKAFTGRLAGDLSGGMKQKLGLACCLIQSPDLLLLDEASVGVDPISRRELWNMVSDTLSENTAVIWSTSYLDEAAKCDEAILLNEGKVLFSGKPSQLNERAKDRTYKIRDDEFQNTSSSYRAFLSRILLDDSIIDATIQGKSIRVLTKTPDVLPPSLEQEKQNGFKILKTPPLFEDGFIDILGGAEKRSALTEGMAEIEEYQQNIIVARNLTKKFGDFTAVDNICFSVKQGEIFGLLGPNGAGKSTTFKMMCGLLKPSAGSAKIAGYDLKEAPSQARSKLGYMAQKFSLYDNLGVLQNLNFFAGIYGLSGNQKQKKINQMIEIFDLKRYLQETAGGLPVGFKQRLALACAVMHNPPVLFLDEPTSGVDPITRREFWLHINALVQKGVTIIITTHFMDEAEYCDRIALVYKSKVIAIGSPDELKNKISTDERPEPTMEDTFIELIKKQDNIRQAA
jgi:ABC-2 type transport system ATP-binding protein